MSRQVLAILTDTLRDDGPIEELCRVANGDGVEVRVVVPAVEATPLRHTLGDIDDSKRQAEARLRTSLDSLRRRGVSASGGVGDPDPVQAAQDALLEAPADEVLIFEHEKGQARWFEDGLLERAQENIEPPLRVVLVHGGEGEGDDRVVGVEKTGAGTIAVDDEIDTAYFPGLSRRDLGGIVAGILGTIVAIVLAAAVTAGVGKETGWEAVAILIAIGIALVNMAHVVGLTLFESVRYRGGFAKLFRTLSLVGTPLAVLANLLILLLA